MAVGDNNSSSGNFGTIINQLQNIVRALGDVTKAVTAVFPQQTGTSTTAAPGSAGAPPAQVAGYITTTVNGVTVKVPYYA